MLPSIVTPVPGPQSRHLADQLARYETRTVTYLAENFPIFWERADGSNVWDVDGNCFLDLTAAFAVTGLGHTAAAVQSALIQQAGTLLHAMGDVHPARLKAELCQKLSAITFERWNAGIGKTFLANSGSEAVEAALKTAHLWSGKPGILSFTGAYHGLGYGALAAGGLPYFREPFRAQLGAFSVQVPFPKADASDLKSTRRQIEQALHSDEIGCIIVEPVQGRGGEVVPPHLFLSMLREICDEYDVLLILDEIYTGFNRTGKLFACEHFGIVPDLICLGKALTGGFPLAACVGRELVMDAWPRSPGEALHTSTMLGNPLGCAMALAAIEEHLKPEVMRQARMVGNRFREALQSLKSPFIRQVRGLGSMLGIELVRENGEPFGALSVAIMLQGLQDGLILLGGGPDGNVLSFSPSFYLSDDEIAFVREKLQEYLISLPGSVS